MVWLVEFHPEFAVEFLRLEISVQDEAVALIELLKVFGPDLRRPYADTLNGSTYSNMKELRFTAGGGVWRVAYAFDPERNAILLVAGDKSGISQRRFHAVLVSKADARFQQHLKSIRPSGIK